MAESTHLQLPLLAAAQAQKHVTQNEALLRLDALVQMSVVDRDLTVPPASPADGDRYIPASGATGAWATWDLNIAWFVDGVWTKLVPREGWRIWVEDEDVLLVWNGAAWQPLDAGSGAAVPASFQVHKNGIDQTGVAPSTETKLTWGAETYDVGGHFDLANNRWTPPAGLVLFTGKVQVKSGAVLDQKLRLRVYKNGAHYRTINVIFAPSTADVDITFAWQDVANGTDFYELYVNLDGAGNKIIHGGDTVTYWQGALLTAAI